MFLSDREILKQMEYGSIVCKPFDRANLSNSSLDLRLGQTIVKHDTSDVVEFGIDSSGKLTVIKPPSASSWDMLERGNYLLAPEEFVLAQTLEYVGHPGDLIISQVADKSTLARLGLSVCFSAGYIDAGNALNITLELKNNGNNPIDLRYGMHICQLKFAYLTSPVINKYEGKYQNSKTCEVAR